jgi:hypothetical protein
MLTILIGRKSCGQQRNMEDRCGFSRNVERTRMLPKREEGRERTLKSWPVYVSRISYEEKEGKTGLKRPGDQALRQYICGGTVTVGVGWRLQEVRGGVRVSRHGNRTDTGCDVTTTRIPEAKMETTADPVMGA